MKPNIGDFLARDGSNLSGIIKVIDNTNGYGPAILFFYSGFKKEDDYMNSGEGNLITSINDNVDRLLTMVDLMKVPSKLSFSAYTEEMKHLLKEAVVWCLMRESLTEKKIYDIK